MIAEPLPEPRQDDARRAAAELVEQRRTERWIFFRELAIALFVGALVAVRFVFGG